MDYIDKPRLLRPGFLGGCPLIYLFWVPSTSEKLLETRINLMDEVKRRSHADVVIAKGTEDVEAHFLAYGGSAKGRHTEIETANPDI